MVVCHGIVSPRVAGSPHSPWRRCSSRAVALQHHRRPHLESRHHRWWRSRPLFAPRHRPRLQCQLLRRRL